MHENTRIMPVEFNYQEPRTVKEALEMLKEYQGKNIKILAGGTDLIVRLKTGAPVTVDHMMNIKEIEELHYVKDEKEGLKIGSVTPLSQVETEPVVTDKYVALAEAVHSMAAIAVRNMATVGGNLCNASPAADTAPPLIAYGAKVKLAGLSGSREVPVEEFFVSPGQSVLKDTEMLVEIDIPVPGPHTGACFIKKTRVKADISKINVAALVTRDGKNCSDCRIVMGSVAPTPIRIKAAEECLKGKTVNTALIKEAARIVSEEIKPIDDNRSTAEYRKEIAYVIVEDAVKMAWKRSGGELND